MPGYPIRTPSDQSSVDSSPRTIAASHVLHRLLMPRHPPCALNNLTNTHIKKSRHKCAQKQKMLASTVQFSTTTRTATTPPTQGSRPTIAPRDTQQDPHKGSGCPLRTQQCAAHPPRDGVSGSSVIPHFSSNPLPPPKQESEDESRGGTGALHHQNMRAQNTRLWTRRPMMFGEAP